MHEWWKWDRNGLPDHFLFAIVRIEHDVLCLSSTNDGGMQVHNHTTCWELCRRLSAFNTDQIFQKEENTFRGTHEWDQLRSWPKFMHKEWVVRSRPVQRQKACNSAKQSSKSWENVAGCSANIWASSFFHTLYARRITFASMWEKKIMIHSERAENDLCQHERPNGVKVSKCHSCDTESAERRPSACTAARKQCNASEKVFYWYSQEPSSRKVRGQSSYNSWLQWSEAVKFWDAW